MMTSGSQQVDMPAKMTTVWDRELIVLKVRELGDFRSKVGVFALGKSPAREYRCRLGFVHLDKTTFARLYSFVTVVSR